MVLISDTIKDIWADVSTSFNEDLGYNCVLIFESGHKETKQVSRVLEGGMPRTVLPFGGRAHGFLHAGHGVMSEITQDPDAIIQLDLTRKTIKARVYDVTRDVDRMGIRITEGKSIFEVVTGKKLIPSILKAKRIILFEDLEERRIEAKLIREPLPYGLGMLHQCRSFWEEI